MTTKIPFNKPFLTGRELDYVAEAARARHLSGDGEFTRRCHRWLETHTGTHKALLTHSCTAALEMTALLAGIGPGDEVIMPSYTFVSTANAFVLRGAVPVFVDIRPDTLNIDETQIEAAITERTRAIVAVHYAGVGCEMDAILELAHRFRLTVIEDAAQGFAATHKGRQLGTIGRLGAFSFHETKNVISGEGGALLINDPTLAERAEHIREKGTNRSQFFRGQVDKYTWIDIGSSYLPGEMIAAFLLAQLEDSASITAERLAIWDRYHEAFADFEYRGVLRRPEVPAECGHNAHMYYVLLPDADLRARVMDDLRGLEIQSVFHYVPLHSSPAGRKYGRAASAMTTTDALADRLLRLPLWAGMGSAQDQVIDALIGALSAEKRSVR